MLADAVTLYKLIHQRFIFSKPGLQEMTELFESKHFGTCPRLLCRGQALLPLGPSALPGQATCKVYCLNCQDLYTPASKSHASSDGVSFGPYFAHFLIRTCLFPNAEKSVLQRTHQRWDQFIPRIYGFRIAQEFSNLRTEQPRDYK